MVPNRLIAGKRVVKLTTPLSAPRKIMNFQPRLLLYILLVGVAAVAPTTPTSAGSLPPICGPQGDCTPLCRIWCHPDVCHVPPRDDLFCEWPCGSIDHPCCVGCDTGETCCEISATCCEGTCYSDTFASDQEMCCPTGTTGCGSFQYGDFTCCDGPCCFGNCGPVGEVCCPPGPQQRRTCPPGHSCCGDAACCNSSESCCDGNCVPTGNFDPPASIPGAELDHIGADFLLAFIREPTPPGGITEELSTIPMQELLLVSDIATNITIQYPAYCPIFLHTETLVPGIVSAVLLPDEVSTSAVADSVNAGAVRVFGDTEFTCIMTCRQFAITDTALALPIDTMGTDYIISTYNSDIVPDDRGRFAVVAAQDDTTISITPTHDLVGHPGGTTFQKHLNQGQVYFAESLSGGPVNDLTGTIVNSDKPVGVTNGNLCTNVPSNVIACDFIFEVSQPTNFWGTTVPIANLPDRVPAGVLYRVLAAEDGTTLQSAVGQFAPQTIDRGEFFEIISASDDVWTADSPIQVTQFMTGGSYSNLTGQDAPIGDPAMINLLPSNQYRNEFTVVALDDLVLSGANHDSTFQKHLITIIAENGDTSTIERNGTAIGPGNFTAIGASGYSVARIEVDAGAHTTSSNNPHSVTIQGYQEWESYGNPGGASFPPVVCGDESADGFEKCDTNDLRGKDCSDFGFQYGELACSDSCFFDTSDCASPLPDCGNGSIDSDECCDGSNLNGATCESLGFAPGGTLTCDPICGFDTSQCVNPSNFDPDLVLVVEGPVAPLGFSAPCNSNCRLIYDSTGITVLDAPEGGTTIDPNIPFPAPAGSGSCDLDLYAEGLTPSTVLGDLPIELQIDPTGGTSFQSVLTKNLTSVDLNISTDPISLGTEISIEMSPAIPPLAFDCGTRADWIGVYSPLVGDDSSPFQILWSPSAFLVGGPSAGQIVAGGNRIHHSTLLQPSSAPGEFDGQLRVRLSNGIELLRETTLPSGSEIPGSLYTIQYVPNVAGEYIASIGAKSTTLRQVDLSVFSDPDHPEENILLESETYHYTAVLLVEENASTLQIAPDSIAVSISSLRSEGSTIDTIHDLVLDRVAGDDGTPDFIVYHSPLERPIILVSDFPINRSEFLTVIPLRTQIGGTIVVRPADQEY